jgi:hypothetical protein
MTNGRAVFAAVLASLLTFGTGTSSSALPMSARIHDCASFSHWFDQQPGSRLTLSDSSPPKAPAPKNGSDEFPIAVVVQTYFKGNVGGGGCLGGNYDAVHHTAAIRHRYDTAQDDIQTEVRSVPAGIRSGWAYAPTLNGVMLGMSLAEVEAVEGRGLRQPSQGDVILAYAWQSNYGPTTVFSSIKFLLVRDRVVAMDFFNGV